VKVRVQLVIWLLVACVGATYAAAQFEVPLYSAKFGKSTIKASCLIGDDVTVRVTTKTGGKVQTTLGASPTKKLLKKQKAFLKAAAAFNFEALQASPKKMALANRQRIALGRAIKRIDECKSGVTVSALLEKLQIDTGGNLAATGSCTPPEFSGFLTSGIESTALLFPLHFEGSGPYTITATGSHMLSNAMEGITAAGNMFVVGDFGSGPQALPFTKLSPETIALELAEGIPGGEHAGTLFGITVIEGNFDIGVCASDILNFDVTSESNSDDSGTGVLPVFTMPLTLRLATDSREESIGITQMPSGVAHIAIPFQKGAFKSAPGAVLPLTIINTTGGANPSACDFSVTALHNDLSIKWVLAKVTLAEQTLKVGTNLTSLALTNGNGHCSSGTSFAAETASHIFVEGEKLTVVVRKDKFAFESLRIKGAGNSTTEILNPSATSTQFLSFRSPTGEIFKITPAEVTYVLEAGEATTRLTMKGIARSTTDAFQFDLTFRFDRNSPQIQSELLLTNNLLEFGARHIELDRVEVVFPLKSDFNTAVISGKANGVQTLTVAANTQVGLAVHETYPTLKKAGADEYLYQPPKLSGMEIVTSNGSSTQIVESDGATTGYPNVPYLSAKNAAGIRVHAMINDMLYQGHNFLKLSNTGTSAPLALQFFGERTTYANGTGVERHILRWNGRMFERGGIFIANTADPVSARDSSQFMNAGVYGVATDTELYNAPRVLPFPVASTTDLKSFLTSVGITKISADDANATLNYQIHRNPNNGNGNNNNRTFEAHFIRWMRTKGGGHLRSGLVDAVYRVVRQVKALPAGVAFDKNVAAKNATGLTVGNQFTDYEHMRIYDWMPRVFHNYHWIPDVLKDFRSQLIGFPGDGLHTRSFSITNLNRIMLTRSLEEIYGVKDEALREQVRNRFSVMLNANCNPKVTPGCSGWITQNVGGKPYLIWLYYQTYWPDASQGYYHDRAFMYNFMLRTMYETMSFLDASDPLQPLLKQRFNGLSLTVRDLMMSQPLNTALHQAETAAQPGAWVYDFINFDPIEGVPSIKNYSTAADYPPHTFLKSLETTNDPVYAERTLENIMYFDKAGANILKSMIADVYFQPIARYWIGKYIP
jgi:hypothetical protein